MHPCPDALSLDPLGPLGVGGGAWSAFDHMALAPLSPVTAPRPASDDVPPGCPRQHEDRLARPAGT